MEFLFAQINIIKKNYFLIFIFLLLIVINDAIILGDFYILKSKKAAIINKNNDSNIISNNENKMYVDIKGEVKKPGVYEVNDSMNVNDVIILAGGLKKSATTESINLSKKVTDQMVIVVLSKTKLKKKVNNDVIAIKNDALITNEETADVITYTSNEDNNKESLTNKLVNINTASLDELMSITGVGKSKADAIITYRESQKFVSIEDVKNVSGIGESLFEKIKDSITV